MTSMNKILSKTGVSALALGMGVALSGGAANALSVDFVSSAGPTLMVTDNLGLDTDPALGLISVLGSATGPIGTFTLGNFSASATDIGNISELSQTTLDVNGGAPGETLTITTTSTFTAAAGTPNASSVAFSLGGAELEGD